MGSLVKLNVVVSVRMPTATRGWQVSPAGSLQTHIWWLWVHPQVAWVENLCGGVKLRTLG